MRPSASWYIKCVTASLLVVLFGVGTIAPDLAESRGIRHSGRSMSHRGHSGFHNHGGHGPGGPGRGAPGRGAPGRGAPGRGAPGRGAPGPGAPGRHVHHHVHVHHMWHPGVHFLWRPPVFWHPFGFFVAALATTAIVVSVANSNDQYYYDQGTYYQETEKDGQKGYVAVAAPIGATVPTLPDGNVEVAVGDKSYYYYAGTFYFPDTDGEHYVVVQAPVGAVIPYLPDGYQKEAHGDITYYSYAGIYYQPKTVSGEVSYEVVSPPQG